MFDIIEKTDRRLATLERGLVVALTGALTIIMMAQVVMRYFFSAPIFWAEEISVQLLVFATLLGISLLVHHGRLVSIDFLPRALKGFAHHGLQALLGVVMLALFAFVCWLGWQWIARPEVRIELGATTQLPRWYNYAVLPAAFVLMAWHQFAAVLRELRALAGGVR